MALIVTSGGLGPTADDLTAEIVGRFSGREMVLDDALEERIAEILRPMMSRWPGLDPDAIRASNRKQAVIPRGATVLDPVGTAPGPGGAAGRRATGPTVVVLPGPPRELQPMWETARGHRRVSRRDRRRDHVPHAGSCGCSGSPSRRSPTRCARPRPTG